MAHTPHHRFVVPMPSGCWEWTGFRNKDGYGGRTAEGSPHRAAFIRAFGDIPAGMCICHRCDNPPCCNPDHLFLGTRSDNQVDASRKRRMRGQDQTHCVNGHEYTPDNTYWRPGTVGARDCRACIRARVTTYRKGKLAQQEQAA